MSLPEALTRMVGCPTFVARRPTGMMLSLSDHQAVRVWGRNGWHKWVPKFSDLVCIDWQVFSPDQIQQLARGEQQ